MRCNTCNTCNPKKHKGCINRNKSINVYTFIFSYRELEILGVTVLHPHKHWVSWCYKKCYNGVTDRENGVTNIKNTGKKYMNNDIKRIYNTLAVMYNDFLKDLDMKQYNEKAQQLCKEYVENKPMLYFCQNLIFAWAPIINCIKHNEDDYKNGG